MGEQSLHDPLLRAQRNHPEQRRTRVAQDCAPQQASLAGPHLEVLRLQRVAGNRAVSDGIVQREGKGNPAEAAKGEVASQIDALSGKYTIKGKVYVPFTDDGLGVSGVNLGSVAFMSGIEIKPKMELAEKNLKKIQTDLALELVKIKAKLALNAGDFTSETTLNANVEGSFDRRKGLEAVGSGARLETGIQFKTKRLALLNATNAALKLWLRARLEARKTDGASKAPLGAGSDAGVALEVSARSGVFELFVEGNVDLNANRDPIWTFDSEGKVVAGVKARFGGKGQSESEDRRLPARPAVIELPREVEDAINEIRPNALVPPGTAEDGTPLSLDQEIVDEFPDAQGVAREIARRMHQAHQEERSVIELKFGGQYSMTGVDQRRLVSFLHRQLKNIGQSIKGALPAPEQPPGVMQIRLTYERVAGTPTYLVMSLR